MISRRKENTFTRYGIYGGKMNAKKIQDEIERNWYWDVRVENMEVLHYFDEVVVEYFDVNDIIAIRFEGCYEVHFQQEPCYEKEKAMKECKQNEIPYYMQDVSVGEVEREGILFYKIIMNIWPMYLTILCKDVRVSRKPKKDTEGL